MKLQQATKLLILISDRIGDVLFATPALAMLKAAVPTCQFDVIATNAVVAEVLAYNPCCQQVFVSPSARQLASLRQAYQGVISFSKNQAVLELIAKLKPLSITSFHDSGDAIPRYQFFVDYISDLLNQNDLPIPSPPSQYQLFPQVEHVQQADTLLAAHGVTQANQLIVCHIGCHRMAKQGKKFWKRTLDTTGSKSWDPQHFAALNQRIIQQFPQAKLLLCGTQGERKLAGALLEMPNVIDVMGQTNLLTLAALLKRSCLLITCDTGPLHIACAMQTPLVALFGKTDPRVWGPYPPQPDRQVVSGESMELIRVDTVFEAVQRQLLVFNNQSLER